MAEKDDLCKTVSSRMFNYTSLPKNLKLTEEKLSLFVKLNLIPSVCRSLRTVVFYPILET